MSTLGIWVIAAMHEDNVAHFGPRFHAAVARHAARPELQAAWRAWSENPELVPGHFPYPQPGYPNMVSPHPAVAAFDALACAMAWGDPDAARLRHECEVACDATGGWLVVAVFRDSPIAALFHGIGPARAQLLPGWFGNFLLSPGEVRNLKSQVEGALMIPGGEFPLVLQRVRDWLNGMGDSGDEDAEELLKGPLRCWSYAIEARMGLCATQTWAG